MTQSSSQGLPRRAMLCAGLASVCTPELLLAAEPQKATLKPYDKVEPQKFPWGWIRWVMNDQIDPNAMVTVGLVEIVAGQTNPLHIHPNCEEVLHVLSGAMEHRIGDEWVKLKTGDTLRIPQGMIHMGRTKDEACRVMVVYNTGARQMTVVEEKK